MALNDKHRKFAEFIVEGKSQAESYKLAGYKSTGKAAEINGSRLIRNDKVLAHIEKLREKASKKTELKLEKVIKILTDTILSEPNDAAMDSSLCELKVTAMGPVAVFMDKAGAIDRLAKILAWYSPEKVEHSVADPLADLMREIREK